MAKREIDISKPGWRPTGVHKLAARFPRLNDADLQALAEDIAENGQRYPIVVDEAGVLIEGRMRLEACDKAGVEPWFEMLNGEDPVAFIWSVNAKRRQMSKGQMAMIAASEFIALPAFNDEPAMTREAAAKAAGVSLKRIDEAVTVARFAPPETLQNVIAGTIMLDAAYAKAIESRQQQQQRDAALATLRAENPDLAQKVEDRELTLETATAELAERREFAARSEASKRETLLRVSQEAWKAVCAWADDAFVAELADRFDDPEFVRQWLLRVRPEAARLKEIMQGAKALHTFFRQATKEHPDV
jgi:ParB-like chromosome segregation protein Spo0J